MVSADNLNFDVLELIFAFLASKDLPNVALVSRSFNAAVLPQLYRVLPFRQFHAKRHDVVMSPFAAVLAHPDLAIHVRQVDIQCIPLYKTGYPHPVFLRQCTQALALCTNLQTFRCSIPSFPSFILSLEDKPRLTTLRMHGSLTTCQVERLLRINTLVSLVVDTATWTILDALPRWAESMEDSLENLTIFMAPDLNEGVLRSTVLSLTRLRSLHVVGCQKIDHNALLNLTEHTPLLESLALTATDSTCPLSTADHTLANLRHLAIDGRWHQSSSNMLTVLNTIMDHINAAAPTLTSFVLRFHERSKTQLTLPLLKPILDAHKNTLRTLSFIECTVGLDLVAHICNVCPIIQRLEIGFPAMDPLGQVAFTSMIARSFSIRVLVDLNSHNHGPQSHKLTLSPEGVKNFMSNVRNLRTIITDGRVWTGQRIGGEMKVSFERQAVRQKTSSFWFMPRA
ncbi:uncharacterized protein SCHCODRAFT_02628600 [Schizophyllum commune H4-8]|uniref:uncharacterized protein n=1 Tax=Schizophyllum commune (strain H4-8 / FGSC 9210) TaxID=578458 RepID=UPI00215E2E60|nr:uncharacterized protein SCHCODRAFT_02628600 [Schizophyllum commune H4-8]KAI5891276.1 hypothetical protein SCHCODRAFT_02628600 [Schizophyllum commune H4-8]